MFRFSIATRRDRAAPKLLLPSEAGHPLIMHCKACSVQIHTVEVRGSNPLAPTIESITCRRCSFGFGAIWGQLLNDGTLRLSLCRGHSLDVCVHRDADIRVAHLLLHNLHILTVRLQQSAECVPERMPTDLLLNTGADSSRFDVLLHRAIRPERLLTVHLHRREDVILGLVVDALSTPTQQDFRQSRFQRYRRTACFLLSSVSFCLTIPRFNRISPVSKSQSDQRNPMTSDMRNPVVPATKTIVRKIPSSSSRRAFSSSAVRTSGSRRSFTLCRTSVIGLRSKNSQRIACAKIACIIFRTFARLPLANFFRVLSQDSTATVRTSDNEQSPHLGAIHLLMYP